MHQEEFKLFAAIYMLKALDVAQGKIYIGCADSSIQVSEIF